MGVGEVVYRSWQRGHRTEGTIIGHGACSQFGKRGGFKTKERGAREGQRQRRERKKGSKNKVSIHKEM